MKKLNIVIVLFVFLIVAFFLNSNSIAKYPYFSCYQQFGDPSCWRPNGCPGNFATGVGCTLNCWWDKDSHAGYADCGDGP